jgi:hypothetical protein
MMPAFTRREILSATSAVLLLSPSRHLLAAGPAGKVVGMRGQCTVERSGQSISLKLGDAIAGADTIVVPADGRLKVRLDEGSVISLASGTRMTLTEYQVDATGHRQNVQLSLASGLVRAVVAPVDHPAKFEVSTAVGTAAVRSTDWFIEAQPGSAQVGVLEGSVVLTSSATGRAVAIPMRWGARLEAGRDPVQARVWAPEEFQAVTSRTDVP